MRLQFQTRASRRMLAAVFGALIVIATAPGNAAPRYWLKILHNFCTQQDCVDGSGSLAALAMDTSGALYGTASNGGVGNGGAVFQLTYSSTADKWHYDRLDSLCRTPACAHGSQPLSKLVVDTSGNLYGTTPNGGTKGGGTVFEVVRQSGTPKIKTLYNFDVSASGGAVPNAELTYAGAETGAPYDGVSPLYGTTSAGSPNGYGGAFMLKNTGAHWREIALYDFCAQTDCADGARPAAGLTVASDGTLYGTTLFGGTSDNGGHGVVFSLKSSRGVVHETVLHAFCSAANCADGGHNYVGNSDYAVSSPLLIDSAGNLFGAAPTGGAHGGGCCGVLFKIVPNGASSQYTVLYDFCAQAQCTDGSIPNGGLVMDDTGNLFGTTATGGGHDIDEFEVGGGTVFELSGSTLRTLYAFCAKPDCTDGKYPVSGVIMDGSGNIFSTTLEGGTQGSGTVFELKP
jgi:hypothetical protein